MDIGTGKSQHNGAPIGQNGEKSAHLCRSICRRQTPNTNTHLRRHNRARTKAGCSGANCGTPVAASEWGFARESVGGGDLPTVANWGNILYNLVDDGKLESRRIDYGIGAVGYRLPNLINIIQKLFASPRLSGGHRRQ